MAIAFEEGNGRQPLRLQSLKPPVHVQAAAAVSRLPLTMLGVCISTSLHQTGLANHPGMGLRGLALGNGPHLRPMVIFEGPTQ